MNHVDPNLHTSHCEWRLLSDECMAARDAFEMDIGILAYVVGVVPETFSCSVTPDLSRSAELQIRRLVEVAAVARLLIGEADLGCWLRRPNAGLEHRSPLSMMLRAGGLAHLRDLLRDALEELMEGGS